MLSGRYRICLATTPLIISGLLILLFARAQGPSTLVVGCVFGTLLGHATIAASWSVLGPSDVVWRLPLSLTWILLLCGAWEINLHRQALGAQGAGVVMGACLLGQFSLVQLGLSSVAIGFGIRLRRHREADPSPVQPAGQVSVRQVMGLMAVIGVGLALGRLFSPLIVSGLARVGEWPIYRALALAAFVMTTPLMAATLLPRRFAPATLFALIPIGLAAVWEPPFLRLVGESMLSQRDLNAVNAVAALWILAFAAVVRLNGYRLAKTKPEARSSRVL